MDHKEQVNRLVENILKEAKKIRRKKWEDVVPKRLERRVVDLKNLGLTEIPNSVLYSKKPITDLQLNLNRIKVIPPGISNLKKLKTLNLAKNQISFLPSQLFDLRKLTTLILSNNRISKIPNAIAKLQSLEHLAVEGNRIKHLPRAILSLGSLKRIDIGTSETHKDDFVVEELLKRGDVEVRFFNWRE